VTSIAAACVAGMIYRLTSVISAGTALDYAELSSACRGCHSKFQAGRLSLDDLLPL